MTYGFIITRHVNSDKTNRYWNQCIKLIKTFYPLSKIVIIDDNSDYKFIKADFEYKDLVIIQSEYPGRGELLPYIYYLKYKWFENAIITHDSVFIHKKINFDNLKYKVMPLWHHKYDKENLQNLIRISSRLKNNKYIKYKLKSSNNVLLGLYNENFDLCFGVQCYINLNFLQSLENKYQISNLVSVILNRKDRCGLERIMGVLFNNEYLKNISCKSLFGDIFSHHKAFSYTYDNYSDHLKVKKVAGPFVKVWTGR